MHESTIGMISSIVEAQVCFFPSMFIRKDIINVTDCCRHFFFAISPRRSGITRIIRKMNYRTIYDRRFL